MLPHHCLVIVMKMLYTTRFPDLSTRQREIEYADDVDFTDEDKKALKKLFSRATKTLRDVNLFTIEDKTEFIHVYLSDIHNLGENETSL